MLLRSTLIYGPAVLFTRLGAFLFVIMATRLLDQAEYGLLTLVVTVGEMIDIAVSEWMRIALLRLGGTGSVSGGSLKRAGFLLMGTTTLALLLAVPASAVVVPDRWQEFSIAVSFYLIAGSIARFSLIVLQMQQRHTAYLLLEFLRAALQLGLPIISIASDHKSFLVISLASSLGTLVAGLVAGWVAAKRVVPGPSRFTKREFFVLGLPIVAVALVSLGLNSAERVILNAYHGAAPVAVFAALYALARQPISMIANAVNLGSFPEALARFDRDGAQAASRFVTEIMALMLSLSLPAAALLIALGDDLVRFILPSEYSAGSTTLLFAIMIFSVICINVADYTYGTMIHAFKRPHLLIINKVFGSVTSVALSLLLIPMWSEIGAALALAGGALANLAVAMVVNRQMTPISFPWVPAALAVVIAAATGAVAVCSSTLVQWLPTIVRLGLVGSISGIVALALNAFFYPQAASGHLRRLSLTLPKRRGTT